MHTRQIHIQLADVCHFLLGLPHTYFYFYFEWDGKRHKPLSHDTTADTQRLAPIRPPRPIVPSAPAHDGALDSTAAPMRSPYPFHQENVNSLEATSFTSFTSITGITRVC